MDFETLFGLILLAVYFILQLLGGRKRPGQQPPREQPAPVPDGERHEASETGLDDAFREIRDILTGGAGHQAPQAPSPEPPRHKPTRTKPKTTGPAPKRREPALPVAREVDPHEQQESAASKKKARISYYRKRLQGRETFKEAFLMKEILGPPKAHGGNKGPL